ncbi:MAG: DUF721 domain-containing protein [Deltaproteobacteria bacterium]|nr:DUF721 domain-containing protein [Deltaproteobacteria bacterium]
MKSIKEVLEEYFKGGDAPPVGEVINLQKQWAQLVGPVVSKNSEPLSLKGNRLVIWVRNSSWANELSLMTSELLTKLRTNDLCKNVEEIRFTLRKS